MAPGETAEDIAQHVDDIDYTQHAEFLEKPDPLRFKAPTAKLPSSLIERVIVIDENLSPTLAKALETEGFTTKVFPKGTSDDAIISWAKNNNAAVMTENVQDFIDQDVLTIAVDSTAKNKSLIPIVASRMKALAEADVQTYGAFNTAKKIDLLSDSGGPITVNEVLEMSRRR